MDNEIKVEAQTIWRKLLDALKQLDCFRVELIGGKVHIYEPECTGVYYTFDHKYIIVAISCDQLAPGRSEQFFHTRKNQAFLRGILGRHFEILAEDGTLYFRVPAHQALEPIAA